MTNDNAEMVIHPVRLRILQSLAGGPKTTQQIAEQLSDVPVSSLYRHIKLLLNSEFITVAEIHVVQGIQEKVYELNRPARLGPDDMAGISAEDHLRYFTNYLMVLLRGFSGYLFSSTEPDFAADRTGYTELSFWATQEEVDAFTASINEALKPLIKNKADEGRRRRRIAIILFPENERYEQ